MIVSSLIYGGLIGLLILACTALAVHLRIRHFKLQWWRIQRIPIAIGVVLGAISGCASYPTNDSTRVIGIPFPAAVFQKQAGVWMDFVGPMTLPSMVGNFALFFLVPQPVVLWRLRARAQRKAG